MNDEIETAMIIAISEAIVFMAHAALA